MNILCKNSGGLGQRLHLHGIRGAFLFSLALCLGTGVLYGAEVDLREVAVEPADENIGSLARDFQHDLSEPGGERQLLEDFGDFAITNSILENDARLKARLENAIESQSEKELMKFLDMEIGDLYKRQVLLAMGEIYERQDSPSRIIALYEKFILELPKDKELPKIYLKLGRLYRDSGATKTALAKFYNVLNVALNIPVMELKEYQEISHMAQMEIAETFFSIGRYDQAAKFFKRLLKIDLPDEDHKNVFFKYAYNIFLTGDYSESASSLGSFVNEFPDCNLTPEARYLLSETYIHLNDPQAALRETLELLSAEVTKIETHPETWLYWKKRTGNKLANQFYEEGNFMDSLTIYRAMIGLSREPEWSWPVLYQIGLCYERLDMKPKAMEAYQGIIKADEKLPEESKKDLTLVSIREMALWRLGRITLDLEMDSNLQNILNNS
jgi:tetratricopeptide (TPR) repeat protein